MYEALYRKYRPNTFDDVVGQSAVTDTLKNQVRTGKLSHAYLFIGARGTGKTTCARILAKAVNCLHPVNGNPCNACASCTGIDNGTILDVVEMDAASNNGVDDVRLLRDEAIFSPVSASKRVYIIDEVHMLSKPAFNALLKILEEPPSHLMFILATTELQKVLPTILSRCQRHSFRRLDADIISARLKYVAEKEGLALTEDAAALLSQLADGGMRDALSLLDQCSSAGTINAEYVLQTVGMAGLERIQSLFSCVLRHDVAGALRLFDALWIDGRDPSSLMSELASYMRDILVMKIAPKAGRMLVSGGAAPLLPGERLPDERELLSYLEIIRRAQTSSTGIVSPRLQAELCLIELCGAKPSGKTEASFSFPEVPAQERISPAPAAPAPPAAAAGPEIAQTAEPVIAAAAEPESTEAAVPQAPQEEVLSEAPPAVPPAAPAAVSDAGAQDLLLQITEKMHMIPGMRAAMTDPSQTMASFSDNGELVLRLSDNHVALQLIDRRWIETVQNIASDIRSAPTVVKVVYEGREIIRSTGKWNELTKFPVVTVK